MNNFKKILTATAVATFVSTSAIAGEGMTGFSIGIIGSQSDFTTTGKEIRGPQTITGNAIRTTGATVSKSVDVGSVFVEYTGVDGVAMITAGIEYVPGSAEIGAKSRADDNSDANQSQDDGTYTAKATVSDYISIYAEPGFALNDNIGFYGKLGLSSVMVESGESIAIGGASSTYGDKRIVGGMVGLGVKIRSPWGLFAKIEATRNRYQKFELVSQTGNKNTIEAQPQMDAVRLAIGYNF